MAASSSSDMDDTWYLYQCFKFTWYLYQCFWRDGRYGFHTWTFFLDTECAPDAPIVRSQTLHAQTHGNNYEVWGGIAGMAIANSCAVEYQGNNNPHAHGHVHFVSVYQHKSLEELGKLIKEKLLAPETLYEYQELYIDTLHRTRTLYTCTRNIILAPDTLHRTCSFSELSPEEHEAKRSSMEQAWRSKFRDSEHDGLAQFPTIVLNDHSDTLWNFKQDPRSAERDAIEYSKRYKEEAEFVMCRTNNHVHLKDPVTGKRRPLPGCLTKKDVFLIQKDCSMRGSWI